MATLDWRTRQLVWGQRHRIEVVVSAILLYDAVTDAGYDASNVADVAANLRTTGKGKEVVWEKSLLADSDNIDWDEASETAGIVILATDFSDTFAVNGTYRLDFLLEMDDGEKFRPNLDFWGGVYRDFQFTPQGIT